MDWNKIAADLAPTGKKVGPNRYFHRTALKPHLADQLDQLHEGKLPEWNIARLPLRGDTITLGWYPKFGEHAFPALKRSVNINLTTGKVAARNYRKNRPILHRCELFILPSHEWWYRRYVTATAVVEAAGLFDLPLSKIGFERFWGNALKDAGLKVDGLKVIPR